MEGGKRWEKGHTDPHPLTSKKMFENVRKKWQININGVRDVPWEWSGAIEYTGGQLCKW